MRREWPAILIALVLVSALMSGCATGRGTRGDEALEPIQSCSIPIAPADSRLLFDPYAEYPIAANLVYRGDWPSTVSGVPGPERTVYRESIYDIQGLRGFSRDLTYRRFRVERIGELAR
jgi:predicted small secreted protein